MENQQNFSTRQDGKRLAEHLTMELRAYFERDLVNCRPVVPKLSDRQEFTVYRLTSFSSKKLAHITEGLSPEGDYCIDISENHPRVIHASKRLLMENEYDFERCTIHGANTDLLLVELKDKPRE